MAVGFLERLKTRESKLKGDARTVYIECVRLEAGGGRVKPADDAALQSAMAELGKNADAFKADVDALRTWNALKTQRVACDDRLARANETAISTTTRIRE